MLHTRESNWKILANFCGFLRKYELYQGWTTIPLFISLIYILFHTINKLKAQLKILKSKCHRPPLCLKKRGEIRKILYQALNQKWAILMHIHSCSFREISVENKIVKKSSFVPTWLRKTFERKMLHSHFCTILFFAHFALLGRYLLRGRYSTLLIFFSPQCSWLI